MNRSRYNRRSALRGFGSLLAASPLLQGQEVAGEPAGRITPRQETVNVFEVEAVAKRKLASTVYSTIAGGDRSAFDKITFRPRMLVNVVQMDLTTELFGEKLFAPILVGPVSQQEQFHPEGELAMVRGAAERKSVVVVSSRSSVPIEKIAAQARSSIWYQVFPESDMGAVRERTQQAVKAGCKAVCLTVGTARLPAAANPHLDWKMIEQFRQAMTVPLVLKGVMSPEEAKSAVQSGAQGIVVSNYGGLLTTGLASTIEMLPSVVDAVGKNVPVLVDGSFRRGSDVLKALAFGARAVLIARPAVWGLAAYGAEGVQTVLEMMQSELARSMGLSGKPNIQAIDRSLVKVHRR